jgi:hypothetical protein
MKSSPKLKAISDEIRTLFASCLLYDELLAARDASEPISPDEIKKRMMNRLKKDMVEMINRSREPGQQRVNPTKLLQQIEKNIDTTRWPFQHRVN